MGEETAAETAPDAATARANASARAKLLGWARRTIDLVPTSWLITGAGGVLLAMTAVFGGLATAPVEPIPEIAVGDVYKGSDFEITVVGVELWNDNGKSGVFPNTDAGEQVLVVTVDVENRFAKPRPSSSVDEKGMLDELRVSPFDTSPEVSRADDGTFSPMLQPNVPARLLLAWLVEPGELLVGDTVTVSLHDATHQVGSSVLRGIDYWVDEGVGATVTSPVTKKDVS